MSPVDDILQRAKRLPAKERRKLVAQLSATLKPKSSRQPAAKAKRKTARGNAGPTARERAALAKFIARAGTVHSDYTDVSSNKYKHLGEIYADQD